MKHLFFLIFLSTASLFSQNVRLEGIISDDGKMPLEMANVMAINQATKAMDAYAITNDKGKYALNLKANSSYTIKLSYVGMANKSVDVMTGSANNIKNFSMEAGGLELEGVEIVREMPVSIKGDTIIYNADSFKNGTERKLEDIVKKLPGMEVTADGGIEVEGKKVQKLLIDGKPFFDGDTKLGLKNIPADAVDKVQVLRNYNEISGLKGVENNQDDVAINIKLKKGKKNFWFGDVSAGIGVGHQEGRHSINPKLFYYSPQYSINLLANVNNIGELPLTFQDYFKFTGGFRNMSRKGGSAFNVSDNSLGISLLRNNRAKEIDTKFGATNFSYNPTKKWGLTGFAIFSDATTELETSSQVSLLAPINLKQITKENSLQKNKLGLFKLSSKYKPTEKLQIDYDILTKVSQQNEVSDLFRTISATTTSTETIFDTKKQNPTSITQNLNFYYTATEKHIFALENTFLYQDENPFLNVNLQNQPFILSGYSSGQNRNNLTQNRFVKTSKFDSKLDYYYVLTSKSNINITLSTTFSSQNFNSNLFQLLDDTSINNLTDSNNRNKVRFNFVDSYLGVHYKILKGKFTFTPGVSLHHYNLNDTQLELRNKKDFSRFLPDLFIQYQLKKAETLTYNFGITNNFTDINQLAEGYVVNGYSNLYRGNRNLENATAQTHSLTYFKYNMFNFENINGNITYSKNNAAIKTNANFIGINQVSTSFNSNFADENFIARGQYGRSFFKYYKTSLSGNLNWSKFNNIQNGTFQTNESFTKSYTIKASTNFKKVPNIEVGFNKSVNDYQGNTFITDKPSLKLDYFFLDSFSFISEYEYYNYYNNERTINNKYDFLSASIVYLKNKDSVLEYKVSVTNLLNTTSLNDDTFSQFSTRTSQYVVQPRYIIFSLQYNL